ncbi:MAG: leucine-rich repeat protein [Clostridia bacterium]|nr:leucine-rich repeat protein [Clostridia bacterium]
MGNYTVIAKGKYAHGQTNDVLHVERFLIVRRKKRRILLLDLNNLAKETLTALRLQIDQFDARGNALGEKVVELKKLTAKPGKFVLKKEIELHRSCIDFRVKILCANYGNYAYRLGDNDTYITYETPKKRAAANKQQLQEELGEKGFSAKSRKHRAPVFVGVFAAIVLAASGVLSYLHLREFTNGRNEFFLRNIKYEYTEEEITAETPLRVVGYIGLGGDKITVPNTVDGHPVTAVKANAFAGNKVLKQLTVESGVVIEDGAFAGCQKLEKVVLEGDGFIGARAFYDCNALKTVEAENVSVIGENAFYECGNLQTLRIVSVENDEMMTIGENAFGACGDLDELYIDRYVAYPIACNYFAGTTSVNNLYLRNYNSEAYEGLGNNTKKLNDLFGGGETEISVENVRIAHTDGIPDYFTQYGGEDMQSFVVDNLKHSEIGAYAFYDCGELTTVSFPKLISTVGAYAFAGAGITSFDGSALADMGVCAFSGCLNLKEFTFEATTLLTVIPDGAFGYSSALQRIFIPSAVTSIGGEAFVGCTSLSSLSFGETSSLTSIYDGAFAECTGLRTVLLPDGLQEIRNKAFEKCKALRYLSIPASVTSMGENVFDCCYKLYEIENLSDISITAGEGLGYYTLKVYTDTEENEPRIPKHTVGDYVIADVDGTHYLIEYEGKGGTITLPSGVNDTPYILTSYLFIETKHVTAVNIPASVEKIGRQVFLDSKIERVNFTSGMNAIVLDSETFANCTQLKALDFGSRDISVMESWIVSGCTGLEELGLSDKTIGIADQAFNGHAALSRVHGGTAVQRVGVSAFSNCAKLTYYEFGDALVFIENDAFQGCLALKQFSGANYIQSIGDSAFKNCSALGSVSFPDTLAVLGAHAFEGCTEMTYVSGANQLTDIPEGAFAGCTGLVTVALPTGLVSLSDSAFSGCSKLSALTVGENLQTIGASAFAGCASLRAFEAPVNLQTIGESAFMDCTALSVFEMPVNLQTIGAGAFTGCTALTKLTGGKYLSSIGENAFYGCTALSVVYLPDNLTYIGDGAFADCPVLHEIYDFSDIVLEKDSLENGCVAYNAIKIHTNPLDTTPLQTLAKGDYTFKVYRGEHTLTNYKGSAASLTLGEVQGITEYAIARYAFKDNSSIKKLTIGDAVTSVRSQSFVNLSGLREIRFDDGAGVQIVDSAFVNCGSIQAIVIPTSLPVMENNAFGGAWLNYYSLSSSKPYQPNLNGAWYYYDECIHENETLLKWNYQNGEINTASKSYDRYTITQNPTCTLGGEKKLYCSTCSDYEEGVYVPETGHSYSNGTSGVCGNCGYIKNMTVNKNTYSTAKNLLTFTTAGSWDIFETNAAEIRSSSEDGQTVTLTLTAKETVWISLEFLLAGENCQIEYGIYDEYGGLRFFGELTESGQAERISQRYLSAGYSIKFTFTKEKLTEQQVNEDGESITIEKENPAYAVIQNIVLTQDNVPSDTRE